MKLTDDQIERLVAEKVMGWFPAVFGVDDIPMWATGLKEVSETMARRQSDWHPITDWRAAGEIVDKMRADGWYFETKDFIHGVRRRFTRVYVSRTTSSESGGFDFQHATYEHALSQRALTIAAALAVGAVTEAQV